MNAIGISFILGGVLALTSTASAAFVTPIMPPWARPDSASAASGSNSTYQQWDGFSSATDASAPTAWVNPNGAASVSDITSATDGVFLIGGPPGDLYSFSAIISPRAVIGGYGIAGNILQVVVEAQTFGSNIDIDGLFANGVKASTLADYRYTQLSSSSSDVGFGTAALVDHEWAFSIPDTSTLQLDWSFGDLSVAFQNLSVDTLSTPVPVPEPASLALLALSAGTLLGRRRRS